jgi:hypothetical protein
MQHMAVNSLGTRRKAQLSVSIQHSSLQQSSYKYRRVYITKTMGFVIRTSATNRMERIDTGKRRGDNMPLTTRP